MPCLLLILSLYSIQNYYPLQTRPLQGVESSCPLLKKDFSKNYCPCPLLKKQLPQKCSSCLLLKKQIKNKYFSCLLFLTTTKKNTQERYEIVKSEPAQSPVRRTFSADETAGASKNFELITLQAIQYQLTQLYHTLTPFATLFAGRLARLL